MSPRTLKIFGFPMEKQRFFKKSRFEVGIYVGCDSDANLAPFCLSISTKIFQKSDPKRDPNFGRIWLRFFLDFGSVLGAKLEPCWPPFSAPDGPRGLQDAAKTPQDALKTPQDAPKTHQDAPRRPQDASQTPPDLHFRRF